jgi:hypothetical protein
MDLVTLAATTVVELGHNSKPVSFPISDGFFFSFEQGSIFWSKNTPPPLFRKYFFLLTTNRFSTPIVNYFL